MSTKKRKTKLKVNTENISDNLNQVATQSTVCQDAATKLQPTAKTAITKSSTQTMKESNKDDYDSLFERWDEQEFTPQDFMVDVPVNSLESKVGYSSLLRQMHQAYIRSVAFYKSSEGGLLSTEEARAKAFHDCDNQKEAKERFCHLARTPMENLSFGALDELHDLAPRVAERLWETVKKEGRKEFTSGHLAANANFPVGFMKQFWNIARYLGVRESFIEDWQPKGGIEIALIDMLAQTYFQWQYWLEQTVKRSETRPREEHPEYSRWMANRKKEHRAEGWTTGSWDRPYLTEQQAIEHAVQLADRFNRIFMRTLRQLRDFRRYSPVTINNPKQVNIANDGGQQINLTKGE